jgi:hypothetical protein
VKILHVLLLLIVAFLAGGAFEHARARRKAIADEIAAERAARILEAQGQRRMMEIADELTRSRVQSERIAADAAGRLRKLAEATPTPGASCPGRNDDARPAAGVIRDETRADLVQLASDADAVADRLRSCQEAVKGK